MVLLVVVVALEFGPGGKRVGGPCLHHAASLEWEVYSSLRADVSYFLPPAEKRRLRNGVANRVPVSCCSGFKFRINYDNRVLFSVPESFPSDRSMIGGRTGLRGGI